MGADFIQKLQGILEQNRLKRALYIEPRLEQMPLAIQRYDDPFLPYAKALITATRDIVCGYVFDTAAFLSIGAAGAIALERAIAYAGEAMPTILHGPFWGSHYAALLDKGAFNADGATIVCVEDVPYYLAKNKVGFVVRNKGDLGTAAHPIYLSDESCFLIGEHSFKVHHLPSVLQDDFQESIRQGLLNADK